MTNFPTEVYNLVHFLFQRVIPMEKDHLEFCNSSSHRDCFFYVKNSGVTTDKNNQLMEFLLKFFEWNLIKAWENDKLSNRGLQSCSLSLSRSNTHWEGSLRILQLLGPSHLFLLHETSCKFLSTIFKKETNHRLKINKGNQTIYLCTISIWNLQ